MVNLDPAAEHFDYQVLAGVCNYAMHGLFTIKSAIKIIVNLKKFLLTLQRMSYPENMSSTWQKVNS